MIKEYQTARPVEQDDLDERKEILSRQCYSVIVEGGFLEFDNAEKWIKENLDIDALSSLFYGKLAYDFGFIEYFFDREADSERFKIAVTDIYTTYPNGMCFKSNGYDEQFAFEK
jgi:hypothetical protein